MFSSIFPSIHLHSFIFFSIMPPKLRPGDAGNTRPLSYYATSGSTVIRADAPSPLGLDTTYDQWTTQKYKSIPDAQTYTTLHLFLLNQASIRKSNLRPLMSISRWCEGYCKTENQKLLEDPLVIFLPQFINLKLLFSLLFYCVWLSLGFYFNPITSSSSFFCFNVPTPPTFPPASGPPGGCSGPQTPSFPSI